MTFDNLDHALTGAKSTVKNLNDITLKGLHARKARSLQKLYIPVFCRGFNMKAELHIDTQELEERITRGVILALKPFLQGKGEDDTLFTVTTLAEYLHVSDQWVYERVHLKEIPYTKLGKFPRFRKSEVDRWMDTMKTPAINPLSRPLKMLKTASCRA